MALKLEHLKNQSLQACASLRQIQSEGMHLMRQMRCAEFLQYAIESDTGIERLNRANFCGQKTCPVCAYIRTSKLRIRLFNGMPRLLADYPGIRFLFLTLTIKNCHFSELRSHIRHVMEAGWHRMHCNSAFPALGFLKGLEITRPRDWFYKGIYIGRPSGYKLNLWRSHLESIPQFDWRQLRAYPTEEVHPHLHILMAVNESYFVRDADEYLSQSQWQNMWKRSARLDYTPIVDIRAVDRLNGGILEVSKYCLKTNDMTDVIGCLAMRQLHGMRLTAIGGIFNNYFSQKAVDAIAQTGKLGNEHWQEGAPCHYQWVNDHYSMVKLANLEWKAA